MNNGIFIKKVYKLQNVPRWDEYAPKFEDNAAVHSYRCAKLAVLVGLLENYKFNNAVDKEIIVAKALLHDLNETKTGSIKYFTKKHEAVSEVIKRVEKEASEEIVELLSPSLRRYFYEAIVNAENLNDIEGRIVADIDTLDALLFCKRERENESSLFFGEKYLELHARLLKSDFASIRYLVEVIHTSGMYGGEEKAYYSIIENMMEMDKIKRWKEKHNMFKDNDASHTFRMTITALFNGMVEKVKYGREDMDLYKVMGKCLFHDLIESITGDVLGPIKHSSPENKKAFEEFEKIISIEMLEGFSGEVKETLKGFIVDSKSDDCEGHLVHIADKIDAMVKSCLEAKINPDEYKESFKKQLKYIQLKYDNPSTVFFLAYIMHDLYN